MDFNIDLNLVQTQKILLTPQLKQALEILRMNSQELFEYAEEQLESNPVLEAGETDENTLDEIREMNNLEDTGWENNDENIQDANISDAEVHNRYDYFRLDNSSVKLTLKEHLLFQLHTSDMDEKQVIYGEYIIDNIDENGYLTIALRDIAAFFNVRVSKIGRVLENIQAFDPPGVGARNIKECLLIQLKQMNKMDELMEKIIQNHLDDLAANKISTIAKKMAVPIQKIVEVFSLIKTLEPKPGREFYNNDNVKFIIPDVTVKKVNQKFEVIINEDSFPILNISAYYNKIISQDISTETRKFIQNRLDSGIWLIRCIEYRKSTIRKVVECIIKYQREFFEKGKKYIKPLNMTTIADEIGMHESAISRTVNGKYLQCIWGIFEIRYFFTGKVSSGSGGEISTEHIKNRLKSIIGSENKLKPLKDIEIVEVLKNESIEISRRTIAKYRMEMGIPSVLKRRR